MFGRFLVLLLVAVSLFAAPPTGAVVLSGQAVLYPIDASQRGTEIINTFTSLKLSPAVGVQVPEVALQTNLPNGIPYKSYQYINNGIVPYIQGIVGTTYNTLLIVSYVTQQQSSLTQVQYIVLPAEQVTAMLYFRLLTNIPPSWKGSNPVPFVSGVIPGTLPYFWVDPKERAADIVKAVTTLKKAPYTQSSQTQIWMQITLKGPFQPTLKTPGLLKNIKEISLDNSLIRIDFLPSDQNGQLLTVLVTPEQVQQIFWIYNINTP